jgi:hypothetical protein
MGDQEAEHHPGMIKHVRWDASSDSYHGTVISGIKSDPKYLVPKQELQMRATISMLCLLL